MKKKQILEEKTRRLLLVYRWALEGKREARLRCIEQQLIEMHTPLVIKLTTRYAQPGTMEYDDFLQQGFIGLINSFRKWKPEKHIGVSFLTFFKYWIFKYQKEFLRDNVVRIPTSVYNYNDLLDAKQSTEFYPEVMDSESLWEWMDGEKTDDRIDVLKALLKRLKKLNPEAHELVREKWLVGVPYNELADKRGVTSENVRQKTLEAIKWLRGNWQHMKNQLQY